MRTENGSPSAAMARSNEGCAASPPHSTRCENPFAPSNVFRACFTNVQLHQVLAYRRKVARLVVSQLEERRA